MKKLVLFFICSLLSLASYAQSYYDFGSHYQSVDVPNPYQDPVEGVLQNMLSRNQHQSAPMQRQRAPQYQQVRGYRYANGNWQIINVQVFIQNNAVYVHSYLNRDANMWIDAYNAQAYRTTRNDGSVVYDNFNYKTPIQGLGYIYF
jgi:hypothetical protein